MTSEPVYQALFLGAGPQMQCDEMLVALIGGGLLRYALRPKRSQTEVLVQPIAGGAVVGMWSAW